MAKERSVLLTAARNAVTMFPTSRRVEAHLTERLRKLGDTPRFHRETADYLDRCASQAVRERRTFAAQLLAKAAEGHRKRVA